MEEKRDYLVFVRVGKNSLHRSWIDESKSRNWDIQLSQYDDDPEIGKGGDLPLSVDKGTKWDSVYRYLMANPDLFDRYKFMMFMDDDLILTTADINRFFKICDENKLLVAQPSLHPDSFCCYPILLQCPGMKLRYTNFVECMAACLRSDYLKEFMPHLSGIVTGWGMDHIWTLLMEDPSYRAAIVDEVSMVHTRPHTNSGGVYDAFSDRKISPHEELDRIKASYENLPDRMIVYGAINKYGARKSGAAIRFANGLHLILGSLRLRKKARAIKSGLGMMIRVFTAHGYRPIRISKIEAE